MTPRTLNALALVAMTIAGFSWIGFQFTGEVLLIVFGALVYVIGFVSFVAYVAVLIDDYLRGGVRFRPLTS